MKVIVGLLLAGLSVAVLADDATTDERHAKMRAKLIEKFNAADTNHDGKLTLEEAQAGLPRLAQNFSKIDTAGHGYITIDDIRMARRQHEGRPRGQHKGAADPAS